METTIMGYIGFRVWGVGFRDNGKNGNYRDYRVYTGIIGDIFG